MMTYRYAVQQGAKFLLITSGGLIKAMGQSERVLRLCRQRKPDDIVLSIERYHERYHELYPDRY